MRVYMGANTLLEGEVFGITSVDGRDSIIVDNEAYELITEFFIIEDCVDWWNRWEDKIRDLYHYCSKTKEFWLCNKCVAKKVKHFGDSTSFVYKGNIFMNWELEIAKTCYVYLGVFTVDGDFVGSMSPLGGISTPELSKLIMQRPEIDWGYAQCGVTSALFS